MKTALMPLGVLLAAFASQATVPQTVLPALAPHLVCHYDFDHPAGGDPTHEMDRGSSGTAIALINGGPAMRVKDADHPGSGFALETRQVNPATAGNDDWKAGIYNKPGVATLQRFASVTGITLMGWIKPTGTNPSLNSTTPTPDDRFGAVGLFGLLSGDSDGHAVRALLEVIEVSGTPRLVALGRRVDGGASHTLAATEDWRVLLPANTWTHLAATFDFDTGTMALYRNGRPLDAMYTSTGDPWTVAGDPEPDRTSPAAPAGIKIGGSFPQNTVERNPFNGRMDDLMFFDTSLTAVDVARQYAAFAAGTGR